jgi:hypothetical protein
MDSGSSKRGTISSSFLSATRKKQRTDDQTSNTNTTSESEVEFAHPGTSNLIIVDTSGNAYESHYASSTTTSSSVHNDNLPPCQSKNSPLEPVPSSTFSTVEPVSPSTSSTSESVSPSMRSTSPVSPSCSSIHIDTHRSSDSTASTSKSISPLLLSSPVDISRSARDQPARPQLPTYKYNNDNRSFQKHWFIDRPWLEYSIERDRAYCYYCRHFGSTNNLINRNQSDSFMTGYNNWRKALEKNKGLRQHETSAAHIAATSNYHEYLAREKSKVTVVNVIEKGRVEKVQKNRERLIKIGSAILLCGRQMISLRGHEENPELVYYCTLDHYFFFVLGQITEATF